VASNIRTAQKASSFKRRVFSEVIVGASERATLSV
jgi:hypothetical protein